jgi:hypothetical protein
MQERIPDLTRLRITRQDEVEAQVAPLETFGAPPHDTASGPAGSAQSGEGMAAASTPVTPPAEGDWSTCTISLESMPLFGDLDGAFRSAEIVHKFVDGGWVAWLLVAQSAALKRVGIRGLGLYPMQRFRGPRQTLFGRAPGDTIGEYTGEVLLHTSDTEGDEARAAIEQLARRGHTKMLIIQRPSGGFDVVNGQGDPPMWRMNDARSIPAASNNVRFTKTGAAQALVTLQPVPSLAQVQRLSELARFELLCGYGSAYWALQNNIGSASAPVEIGARFAHPAPQLSVVARD